MGRGTKRKAAAKASSSSSDNMWNSSSSGGSSSRRSKGGVRGGSKASKNSKNDSLSNINVSAVENMFTDYSDPDDPTSMTMEGISKLCEQLNIDPLEDIRILVLLWKMGANDKPAQINKQEWIQGCNKLSCDSISKFQNILPSLEIGFLERSEFKDFYKFCFQFNRQGTHRTLDKDLVIALLQLLLSNKDLGISQERLSSFCTFLEEGSTGTAGNNNNDKYSRITLDQWTSFLDFCYDVDDLSNYDESTSAWPVLIDEYVEYMEKQQDAMK